MMCSVCKRHDVFFQYCDSDVCEDCTAKAEAAYEERTDYAYWHYDGLPIKHEESE